MALIRGDTADEAGVARVSHGRLKKEELSVCRASYCQASFAQKRIVGSRVTFGVTWALCSEIREIMLRSDRQPDVQEERAFCVLDDAEEDYHAHAHLGYSHPRSEELRHHREAARNNLLNLFARRGVTEDWKQLPFKPELDGADDGEGSGA